MMSAIYFGKIKDEKLGTWQSNSNPYDILVENEEIHKIGGWDFLDYANEFFSDKVQVDWGSFAYKCTGRQVKDLVNKYKCEIESLNVIDADESYGIIFIELY